MTNIIGTLLTIGGSCVLFIFGLVYLIRPKFMGYHKMAVQKEWNELIPEIRTLILALMRTVGGGFISVAAVITILQIEFNKSHQHWIALTILIIGVVLNLSVLYATLLVRVRTKGRPPTFTSLVLLLMLITGYFFNISCL
jgi:hypothetical protein